jgi:GAF domain-containing protein
VLANGKSARIDDVQHDPRFYSGVDAATGVTTRTLVAAPLRTTTGAIGVIEVINPHDLEDGDVEFLEALGSDVAVAHEKAALSAALRDEAAGLRRLGRLAGLGIVALGVGLVAATVFAHAAHALPLRELTDEPGLLLGALVAAGGLVLVAAVRRVPSAS